VSAPAVAEFQQDNPDIVVVSVATDGSADEFAEFIDEYDLGGLHHVSDLDRPGLVASMLIEHDVTGVPGFVAIRPDGRYATHTGWWPSTSRRLASFLSAS